MLYKCQSSDPIIIRDATWRQYAQCIQLFPLGKYFCYFWASNATYRAPNVQPNKVRQLYKDEIRNDTHTSLM